LVTDRCFLYSISTGIVPPVPAPTATLRTSISLAAKKQNGVFTAVGTVNVVDETNGPVSGVAVRILWTLPDGQTQTQTVTSKKKGVVKFNAVGGHGTYNLTVLDASKTNYTFDVLGSMLSASITK
jgi:hypothetical protein